MKTKIGHREHREHRGLKPSPFLLLSVNSVLSVAK
jgi:hypothetical protein